MSTSSRVTASDEVVAPEAAGPQPEVAPAQARRGSLAYRPGLDLVRFFAAIWVMVYHTEAVRGGGHAVALFFVLSGYLIGGQLVDEKVANGSIRLSEFYFKRVTRIWVPYFVVLVLYVALFLLRKQDAVPGFYERLFGASTYTYNLINSIRGNIHPTWVSANQIWSLSIEEQFYLVVPLLIVLLPVRAVGPVCLGLTALAYRIDALYAGLPVGVLFAVYSKRGVPGRASTGAAVAVGLAFLASLGLLFAVGQTEISPSSPITLLLAVAAIFSATYVELPRRTHAALRYLGLMTYSYYLIHTLPPYFLGALTRRLLGIAQIPTWANIVFGLLALPLSFLFVRWIELPVLRWRGELLRSGSPAVRVAPWLAWGLSLVGIAGLVYLARHPR